MKEILFTVNGPGEIYGFTLPLARMFRKLQPDRLVLSLFILPCQFGSGLEDQIAQASGLFDNIFTPKDYKQFLLKKKFREDYQPQEQGIVFYTGGDSWHAVKLAKTLGWRLFGYDEGNLSRRKNFNKIFTIGIDGNLMIDAAQEKKFYYSANPIGCEQVNLALFPGSRPSFMDFTVPFYQEIVNQITNEYPQVKSFFVINPEQKQLWQEKFDIYPVKYSTERFPIDLALTLIGTNTSMLAARAIPMICLLPLNKAEEIPLTGLLGFLGYLPFGKLLKKFLLKIISKRDKLYSIPNLRAEKKVVPEFTGNLDPKEMAKQIIKLLSDINSRNRIAQQAQDVIGKPGAAKKIAEEVLRLLWIF